MEDVMVHATLLSRRTALKVKIYVPLPESNVNGDTPTHSLVPEMKNKGIDFTYRNGTARELSNPQPLNSDNKSIFPFIEKIDKPTVPPLEHTPVGKEKIPFTDL
jgi:hypothetical protein